MNQSSATVIQSRPASSRRVKWFCEVVRLAVVAGGVVFGGVAADGTGNVLSAGGASPPVKVPGVVIAHSHASSGLYIGSPSLAVLANGDYLASHDFFGPKAAEFERPTVSVFRSRDRGATWRRVAELRGLFWANLFVHGGAVYLMGTDKHNGRIVIRRSDDGGVSWTEARDASRGLLTPRGGYHTAPVPVVEHGGRLWRAFEDTGVGAQWGRGLRAGMLSIPTDADLLVATNWTFSNFLAQGSNRPDGKFGAWLEGNAVAAPGGGMIDLLRVDTPGLPEKAAVVELSADGKVASFDPSQGFVNFPGGAKKFTVRPDPKGNGYWTLASVALEAGVGNRGESELAATPTTIRNTLALLRSADLRQWEMRAIILHHPDSVRHGFQYVDWQFDSDDLVAACRTAYDDDEGGGRSAHDANFLTFHRIQRFRSLVGADLGAMFRQFKPE
jgi:hypothetical protein